MHTSNLHRFISPSLSLSLSLSLSVCVCLRERGRRVCVDRSGVDSVNPLLNDVQRAGRSTLPPTPFTSERQLPPPTPGISRDYWCELRFGLLIALILRCGRHSPQPDAPPPPPVLHRPTYVQASRPVDLVPGRVADPSDLLRGQKSSAATSKRKRARN